jgi:hypothetical protein
MPEHTSAWKPAEVVRGRRGWGGDEEEDKLPGRGSTALTTFLLATVTQPTHQNNAFAQERKFQTPTKIAREHRNVHKKEPTKIKPQKHICVKPVLIQKKI